VYILLYLSLTLDLGLPDEPTSELVLTTYLYKCRVRDPLSIHPAHKLVQETCYWMEFIAVFSEARLSSLFLFLFFSFFSLVYFLT
jgi:hypothetical protein